MREARALKEGATDDFTALTKQVGRRLGSDAGWQGCDSALLG